MSIISVNGLCLWYGQQRLCIARALAVEPEVPLMDERLAAAREIGGLGEAVPATSGKTELCLQKIAAVRGKLRRVE